MIREKQPRMENAKNLKNWRQLTFISILCGLVLIFYYNFKNNGKYINLIKPIRVYEFRRTRPNPMEIGQNDSDDKFASIKSFNFTKAKKILYGNKFFSAKNFAFGEGNEPFVKAGCPVTNCYATENQTLLDTLGDFDAILFHMRNGFKVPNQAKRKPHQRYVLFIKESPLHDYTHYGKLKNFFNWTMTYRDDSDIPLPYGTIEPITKPYRYHPKWNERLKWKEYDEEAFKSALKDKDEAFWKLARRPKKVAWIVSHCGTKSKRELYVKELQKHIQVDIMGGCGSIKCSKDCNIDLEKHYKFYLSFENSFCDQYITEKLFLRMNLSVVPIVMGFGNYSKIAPPHSYINVLDFDSPKALAEHILELDKDDEKYLSFFWWKDFYRVTISHANPFCRLCEMLNNPDEPEKVYEDPNDWWIKRAKCIGADHMPWTTPDKMEQRMPELREKINYHRG